MIAVSDQNDRIVLARITDHFNMNLRNKRARGIDDVQPTEPRLFPDFRRHAMRAENCDGAIRNFIETLDEYRALSRQLIDYKPVVDDLFPHVNRTSEFFQCDR